MPVVIAVSGKYSVPQDPVRDVDIHIRMVRQKAFILVIVQIMEHGTVLHVVTVDHRIEIGKILGVFSFSVDTARITLEPSRL